MRSQHAQCWIKICCSFWCRDGAHLVTCTCVTVYNVPGPCVPPDLYWVENLLRSSSLASKIKLSIFFFMFAPCINSIKVLFIISTDAHNYKITGMLKTIKIPTIAPTCFGSRRNHHQGAISCLAKTTIMRYRTLARQAVLPSWHWPRHNDEHNRIIIVLLAKHEMAPWWWFLLEPKHVGAIVGILIVFNIPMIS